MWCAKFEKLIAKSEIENIDDKRCREKSLLQFARLVTSRERVTTKVATVRPAFAYVRTSRANTKPTSKFIARITVRKRLQLTLDRT